jgi:hypothetical protein
MRGRNSDYYQVGLSIFRFVRDAHEESVSASWTSSGRTILLTLQTLQMLLSALSRMTIICTISQFKFLLASPQPDPVCYLSSKLWRTLIPSNQFHSRMLNDRRPGRRSGQP